MNIYASLLALSAVFAFANGDDECSEEATNACLKQLFECVCKKETEMENVTKVCCENSFGKRNFLEEMEKCSDNWIEEEMVECSLPACETTEHCSWEKSEEKFHSYEYKEIPKDKEECKEKYWKDSMDYFDEQCRKETNPAMKEICQLCMGKK